MEYFIDWYRWNLRFETWAQPLSDSEEQKCQNAESVIRSAISSHSPLASENIRVFAQGSYKSNTNVRADSDMDICVCHSDYFFSDYLPGVSREMLGHSDAGMTYERFKELLGNALIARFTYSGVKQGDKAFRVPENTYRIHSDVLPAFEYRKHRVQGGTYIYETGIAFKTRGGQLIVNWPEQTSANGAQKNVRTGYRYKKVVRILKGLRNEMAAASIPSAKNMSSFLIESAVWNVTDSYFGNTTLFDDVKTVVNTLWYISQNDSLCIGLTEVNGIKPLFEPQSRANAHQFFYDVRVYVGII